MQSIKTYRIQVIALVLVLLAVGAGAVVTRARMDKDAASDALTDLVGDGHDAIVVATVEGEPITLRAIDVFLALGSVNGSTDPTGKPLSSLTKDDALERLIRDKALLIAAERSGVSATDEEVSMMVNASLVEPVLTGSMPKDVQRLLESHLAALGLTLATAPNDPELRQAYRRFLMTQRYVAETGKSSGELTDLALSSFSVHRFPERLAP